MESWSITEWNGTESTLPSCPFRFCYGEPLYKGGALDPTKHTSGKPFTSCSLSQTSKQASKQASSKSLQVYKKILCLHCFCLLCLMQIIIYFLTIYKYPVRMSASLDHHVRIHRLCICILHAAFFWSYAQMCMLRMLPACLLLHSSLERLSIPALITVAPPSLSPPSPSLCSSVQPPIATLQSHQTVTAAVVCIATLKLHTKI